MIRQIKLLQSFITVIRSMYEFMIVLDEVINYESTNKKELRILSIKEMTLGLTYFEKKRLNNAVKVLGIESDKMPEIFCTETFSESTNRIEWYERLIISTILTGVVLVVCLVLKSDFWIPFAVGSFGYQFIEIIIKIKEQ